MKKNEEAAAKKKPKTSAAQIRVQKGLYIHVMGNYSVYYCCSFLDLTELDLPSTMKLYHADATNLLNFELTITPDEGLDKHTLCRFVVDR
jgi:ubiquitin-conjugating enzyme E2 M